MTPLTTNSVRLDYAGSSNSDETVSVLQAYTTAVLNQRANREERGSINSAVSTAG